jgi:hypothetical protein
VDNGTSNDDWKGEAFIRNVKRDGVSQQASHQMQGKGGRNIGRLDFSRNTRPTRRKPGKTEALVKEGFDAGMSADDMAQKFGVTRDTIHWHCRRLGLKFRDRDEARGNQA